MKHQKYLNLFAILLIVMVLVSLSGCGEIGYYFQCAKGQINLLQRAKPIEQLLDDPTLTPDLHDRLQLVQQIRDFASSELLLPDNDSYRSYADIERPYVVWNIVATDEFSLQPQQWCFPVAGCVSYRGYFYQEDAEELASQLRQENKDVNLYGVQAYSTLNWFSDPVLNTFINSSETRLAGLIFHELAHQLIYVKGDSAFNEAFAVTVQMEGVHRWLKQQKHAQDWEKYLQSRKQLKTFHQLLFDTRDQLAILYGQDDLSDQQKRLQKEQIFTTTQQRYTELQTRGELDQRFDRWMTEGLNNARLAAIATYYDLLPGFQQLLANHNHNLTTFYQQVEKLAKTSVSERHSALSGPQKSPETH